MSKITGSTAAFQQPYEVHKNESGVRTIVPYESTDAAQILSWQNYAAALGLPFDVKFSHGKGRIDITYPYDFTQNPATEVVNLWELFAQKVEKDILEADLSFGSLAAITPEDAQLIKIALSQYESGIKILSSWFSTPTQLTTDASGKASTAKLTNSDGTDAAAASNPANCYSAFCLMTHGVRSYPILAPCLRHTQTVNAQYAIKASLTNVGKVLSTATLQSNEAIPSGLLFNLPTFTNVNYIIEEADDLKYGWYKDFPTVRQIAGSKWNIEQEWQYGLYSIKLYGAPL
jgi:hypothetical protein